MVFEPELGYLELKIVPRNNWSEKDPLWRKPLYYPLLYIFYAVTNTHHCFDEDTCLQELKFIQNKNMTALFAKSPDIRYNFLIADNGKIYEGRGWSDRPTLPKKYGAYSPSSLFIGFIGRYKDYPPDDQVLKARRNLIKFGVERKLIHHRFLDIYLQKMNMASPTWG